VPTAADVAIFDQAATYTVTFSGVNNRTALTLLNTAGTVTFAGTASVALGGLTLEATAVWTHSGTLNFTVAGTHTIDTKNVRVRSPRFSASGTSWTLASDFSTQLNNPTTLDLGTLNLNDYTFRADSFSSNTFSTRRLNFGTGQIIITGGATEPINFNAVSTGLVMSGSKKIVLIDRLYTANPIVNDHEISLYVTAGTYLLIFTGTSTLGTFDCTGFTGTIRGNLSIKGDLTFAAGTVWTQLANTMTFNGTGTQLITTNGVLLPIVSVNAVGGTVRLLDSLTASGTSRLSAGTLDLNGFILTSEQFYADTGSAARTLAFGVGQITVTGLVTSVIVDFYNSSFPSALTMTGSKRVNISSARTVVALADFGSYEVDLYVTQGAYSLGISGSTVVRNADFTGFTGSVGGSMDLTGNLILGAGMSEGDGTLSLTTSGTGLQTITSNGRVVVNYLRIIGTGTVRLQDAFTFKPEGSLEMNNGVLDLNGFAMEVWQANLFSYDDFGDPTTPELIMGAGVLRVEYGLGLDGGLWDEGYLLPTITGPGTIEFFLGAEPFYGGIIGWLVTGPLDPRVAVFPTVRHTGTASLQVLGNNTFQSFESLSAAGSVTFIFGETSTFGSFNMSGAPGNLKTLTAGDAGYIPGTQATLIKGSPWLVGANSIDDGNNTGLTFASGGGIDYLVISNIRTTDAPIPVEGWILINDSQTANWQNANNTQTSNWQNASNAQTPNWQNIIDTQTPNWQNIIDAQSPGWTPTNQ
jgi:hypothetical protein